MAVDPVGQITTTLGGDPAMITVDFDAGVRPPVGGWLATSVGSRYRVLDARRLDTAPNRWRMRCARMPRNAHIGSDEPVLLIRGKPRPGSALAEAARS